jgi:hypothetical protein
LIKTLPSVAEAVFGFHHRYGFISEANAEDRELARRLKGLPYKEGKPWGFQFKILSQAAKDGAAQFVVEALSGCEAKKTQEGWMLKTTGGTEFLLSSAPAKLERVLMASTQDERLMKRISAVIAFLFLLVLLIPMPNQKVDEIAQIEEPVTVKIVQRDAVVVPKFQSMELPENLKKQVENKKMQRAIQQDLGFLGMLGKKNLTKALGGMPTSLKNASAGAGPGGTEGSGGEVLQGLGQGVKRITVGNSGVAGLGGIGTKGAGGGAGGYGNAMVGSGEGKRLSSVPLSQDVTLEGGLDRAVVQATIAKYLSQVRACYEDGLRKRPGIQGVVGVDFEIGGAGDVLKSNVGKSTLGDPGVESCITARAKTWKFPKPLGGVNVKVNYPFLLRPVS